MRTGTHTRLTTNTLIGCPVDEGHKTVTKDTRPDTANRPLVQTATAPPSGHSGPSVVNPQTRPTVDALCRTDRIARPILLQMANVALLACKLAYDLRQQAGPTRPLSVATSHRPPAISAMRPLAVCEAIAAATAANALLMATQRPTYTPSPKMVSAYTKAWRPREEQAGLGFSTPLTDLRRLRTATSCRTGIQTGHTILVTVLAFKGNYESGLFRKCRDRPFNGITCFIFVFIFYIYGQCKHAICLWSGVSFSPDNTTVIARVQNSNSGAKMFCMI